MTTLIIIITVIKYCYYYCPDCPNIWIFTNTLPDMATLSIPIYIYIYIWGNMVR